MTTDRQWISPCVNSAKSDYVDNVLCIFVMYHCCYLHVMYKINKHVLTVFSVHFLMKTVVGVTFHISN